MAFIDLTLQKIDISRSRRFFLFSGKEILLHRNGTFPDSKEFSKILESEKPRAAFFEDSYRYSAVLLENFTPTKKLVPFPIQSVFAAKNAEDTFLSARARSLLKWRTSMKFCQECGSPLSDDEKFSARTCSACKKQYFPRIEPCVICLVKKGNYVLLARHANRLTDKFVCIAGFIESGETAEQAVLREVLEETGIRVKNPVYRGSQGWPFPDQLMLAFTAEYEGGEIKIQKEELLEAAWFEKDKIPNELTPGSAAWNLLNDRF